MKNKSLIIARIVNSLLLTALSVYLMSIPATALTKKTENNKNVNYTNSQNLSEGDERFSNN